MVLTKNSVQQRALLTQRIVKSGKKYYFRVRTYKTVDGKNIYGGYKTYSVKVK